MHFRAAQAAKAADAGAYAMERLKERLEQYDFPVLSQPSGVSRIGS